MDRMNKMRDLEKQAATPEQKSKDDWRKKAFYNFNQNSEAPQEKTSSSSDRDLELGAMTFTDRRLKLRERRWQENRSGSGVAAASTEHQIHWHRRQESKAKFRHNDAHPNPRKLGRQKGWSSEAINRFKDWHEGKVEDAYLDLVRCNQDQYIQNNYHKDETEEQ